VRTDDEIATTLALWSAGLLRRRDVVTLLGLPYPDGLESLLLWMPIAYDFDLPIPSRRKADQIA
jgi:hypothetical protein